LDHLKKQVQTSVWRESVMKERKPHILDSIFEKVKNPTAGKSCVSSQRSEESEDLSEKSKRQVTV
jgi:hypothetical protein